MSDLIGLGRLEAKDERDAKFQLAPRREAANRTNRYWTSRPALDQGATSQCVGYSGYQWLTSFPISNKPRLAPEGLYRAAQLVDEWPGENYEGTSVRALFRVLKTEGYVSEYRWAPDVATIVDHLLTVGPVVVGTIWTYGMFMADREGYIDDIGGNVIGGHAYLLVGASRTRKSKQHGIGAVRVLNSWGPSWSEKGRAWLSFAALEWLMSQDGEACSAMELIA